MIAQVSGRWAPRDRDIIKATKEKFVRATTMRLQQQQLLIRAQLDRAYDDHLSRRGVWSQCLRLGRLWLLQRRGFDASQGMQLADEPHR